MTIDRRGLTSSSNSLLNMKFLHTYLLLYTVWTSLDQKPLLGVEDLVQQLPPARTLSTTDSASDRTLLLRPSINNPDN